MGIIAFNWGEGKNNQLTLLMNRDNWENRVISGTSWNRNGQILSGRCVANNGTWFGISKRGRVAFLVNAEILLDDVDQYTGSELYPIEFLESKKSPLEFADHVARRERQRHNNGYMSDPAEGWSYSLIVADMTLNSMVHIRKPVQAESNVMIQPVPFGVHTLSPYDGLDSTELPRDLRLRSLFSQMILDLGNNELMEEISWRFMYDAEGGRDAVFLQTRDDHPSGELGMLRFGTTSTTALVVKRTREVMLFERYMEVNGAWTTHDFAFNIQ
ncbi:Transport and Golgi organization protein 2 [Arabidopsis suecica]|uniref:Transport and Golgi organization protein 2 n=1 Tax=Arabidopsis suecica TaxID=45249 RepID=A0A8T2CGR6_ARASU|nr:Transport and Golgi organization protein 2 [Arabidopsis suecica]